jgi:hypothetical protein
MEWERGDSVTSVAGLGVDTSSANLGQKQVSAEFRCPSFLLTHTSDTLNTVYFSRNLRPML